MVQVVFTHYSEKLSLHYFLMNTWTCIISHHLGYEGEVCGSAVRQKGTVVMSRPWASVHPQHGADSRGGRWWAHAALGGSFPGRARPLASVHLMGGAEELGIPQLRERHVRSTRAVNLSQSHKSGKKRKMMQEKKRKERRNPQKRREKAGQLKKKTGWPPLKKKKKLSAFPSTELCLRSSLALSSAELMRMSGRRSFWMWSWVTDWQPT